jgi:hypothetical protein
VLEGVDVEGSGVLDDAGGAVGAVGAVGVVPEEGGYCHEKIVVAFSVGPGKSSQNENG